MGCYAGLPKTWPKAAVKKGLQFLIWPFLALKKVVSPPLKKTKFPSFAHTKSPQIGLYDGDNTPSPAPNYSTTNLTTNTIQ